MQSHFVLPETFCHFGDTWRSTKNTLNTCRVILSFWGHFLFFWRQTDTCTSRHCWGFSSFLESVFVILVSFRFCVILVVRGGRAEGRGTKQSAICQAQAHMARAVVLQEAGFSRLACSFPQRNSRHPGERGFGPQPGGDLRQLERCNSVWGIVWKYLWVLSPMEFLLCAGLCHPSPVPVGVPVRDPSPVPAGVPVLTSPVSGVAHVLTAPVVTQ